MSCRCARGCRCDQRRELVRQVRNDPDRPALAILAVYRALIDNVGADWQCSLALADLADDACVNRTTASSAVRWLVKRGYLTTLSGGGRGVVNLFEIVVANRSETGALRAGLEMQNSSETGALRAGLAAKTDPRTHARDNPEPPVVNPGGEINATSAYKHSAPVPIEPAGQPAARAGAREAKHHPRTADQLEEIVHFWSSKMPPDVLAACVARAHDLNRAGPEYINDLFAEAAREAEVVQPYVQQHMARMQLHSLQGGRGETRAERTRREHAQAISELPMGEVV